MLGLVEGLRGERFLVSEGNFLKREEEARTGEVGVHE